LNLNFTRICENRIQLVEEVVELLKVKVGGEQSKECEQILRRARIKILQDTGKTVMEL
jgi:hypothetical protein